MTLNDHFALKSVLGSACHGFACSGFKTKLLTVRKFAELRSTYTYIHVLSAAIVYSMDSSFWSHKFYGVIH